RQGSAMHACSRAPGAPGRPEAIPKRSVQPVIRSVHRHPSGRSLGPSKNREMRNLPPIGASHWLTLVAASTFGTNTGDFVARYLHVGHLAGLPYMALLFGAIVVLARWARRGHALYFWAAIITMRTAATNVADAFQDFHVPYSVSIAFVLLLFVASV